MQIDRRKFKRVKVEKIGADYALADFTFWAEYRAKGNTALKDISLGGIRLQTSETLPKDSLLCLQLKTGDIVKIGDVYGRVVRFEKNSSGAGYEIGITFSWWDDERDKKKLSAILGLSSSLPATA